MMMPPPKVIQLDGPKPPEYLRRITKVKRKDEKIIIHWRKVDVSQHPAQIITCGTVECAEAADPAFYESFDGLGAHVADLLEMTPEWGQKFHAKGVSFSWRENAGGDTDRRGAIMGAVVTGQINIKKANSPLLINTPHVPEQPYSAESPEPTLSVEFIIQLEEVMLQAEYYLDGKRAQVSLFEKGVAA